jgi:hypothetical protein
MGQENPGYLNQSGMFKTQYLHNTGPNSFVRYIEGSSTSAKVKVYKRLFVLLQWTSSKASKYLEFSRTKKSPVYN